MAKWVIFLFSSCSPPFSLLRPVLGNPGRRPVHPFQTCLTATKFKDLPDCASCPGSPGNPVPILVGRETPWNPSATQNRVREPAVEVSANLPAGEQAERRPDLGEWQGLPPAPGNAGFSWYGGPWGDHFRLQSSQGRDGGGKAQRTIGQGASHRRQVGFRALPG
jgi:hypothetical protein